MTSDLGKPKIGFCGLIAESKARALRDLIELVEESSLKGSAIFLSPTKARESCKRLCHMLAMDDHSEETFAALSVGYFKGREDPIFDVFQLYDLLMFSEDGKRVINKYS